MRLIALVISNGATSMVSLMATVLVGRQEGPSQLGVFGLSFALMSLAQLFALEVGVNRALSSPDDLQQRQVAYSRALCVSLFVSIPTAAVGLALANPIIVVMAMVIPGYVMFSFLRQLTMTDGSVWRGFIADAVLLGSLALSSVTVVAFDLTSVAVLIAWALALPLGCSILHSKLHVEVKVGWRSASRQYAGVSFGVQSLLGAGSVHLSTFVLAGLFGPVLVGAMRGASTVLGPVNLVTTSIGTFSLRQLGVAGQAQRFRTMLVWQVISIGVAATGATLLWILMANFGAVVLGESWPAVEPLVPWVSLDAALVSLGIVARAAHRVDERGMAALRVSIVLSAARLLLLPLGGWWAGATGVVMALALVSLMSGILWWLSYFMYRRQKRSGAN